MQKPLQLSREALGTRRFKYTAGVTRLLDGSFELLVTAVGVQGEHRMPEPATERRPVVAPDLTELRAKAEAFLADWREAHPECANQILCCTRTVDNALKVAVKKLAALPR